MIIKLKTFWLKLTTGSSNRQIFGSFLIVGFMTIVVKFCSILKEILVAWRFGINDDLDAFFMAFIIISFFWNVIFGSLASAFLPVYVKIKENKGIKSAQDFFSHTLFINVILVLIVGLLVLISNFYLPLLTQGFNINKLKLTNQLLWEMFPWLSFSGFALIYTSVLNSLKSFSIPALLNIIIPLLTIIFLIFNAFPNIHLLTLAMDFGGLIELSILILMLNYHNLLLKPKWKEWNEDLGILLSQSFSMMMNSLIMSSSVIIDQSMTAKLGSGSVTALNYGNKLTALPLTLIVTPLNVSVFPYLSEMVAKQNWIEAKNCIKKYLKGIFILTIPLIILLINFSELLVKILFERGSFSAQDTILVSEIQICYLLQIPFYLASGFLAKYLSALLLNQVLGIVAVINIGLNIILNYWFSSFMGVAGIALSTSVVYFFSFLYLYFYLLIFKKNFI